MVHNHSPLLTMVKPVLMYLYSTLPRVLFVVYENTMFQSYRPFCSGFGADRTEAVLKSLTLLSNKRATNSTHPGMSQCAVKSGLSLSLKNVLRSIFTPTFSQASGQLLRVPVLTHHLDCTGWWIQVVPWNSPSLRTNRFRQSKGNRIVRAPLESTPKKEDMSFIVHHQLSIHSVIVPIAIIKRPLWISQLLAVWYSL